MEKAYQYCVWLLSKQDYSEFKMRQKLRMKKYLPPEIEETITKLKSKGFLREENYRRLFIRKWMIKGEAEDKIRSRGAMEKLQFSKEEFDTVSQELGLSDEDNLEKLIQKKLRMKAIPQEREAKFKLRDKVLRFLISKGHDYSEAKSALQKFFT